MSLKTVKIGRAAGVARSWL